MWKKITENEAKDFADVVKLANFPCGNDTITRVIHYLRNKIGSELFIYVGEKFTNALGVKYQSQDDVYRFTHLSTDFRGVEDIELAEEAAKIHCKKMYDFLKEKDKIGISPRLENGLIDNDLIPKNKTWIPNYTEFFESMCRSVGLDVQREGVNWVFRWRQGL